MDRRGLTWIACICLLAGSLWLAGGLAWAADAPAPRAADGAADVTLAYGPGMVALPTGIYQFVTVKADGSTPSHLTITVGNGPAPIPPTPVPPGPTTTLAGVAKTALASVPQYADRDTHLRGIAFGFGMLGPQLKQSAKPVADGFPVLQQFGETVTGADKAKWATFWTTLQAKIIAMISSGEIKTNADLSAACATILEVLEAEIPQSGPDQSGVFGGAQSYGLDKIDPAFWKMILEILLPLLIKLISGL